MKIFFFKENKIKLRNILSVDVIHLPVYEANKKVIEEANKKLEENNLTLKTTLYAFYKGNTMYVVRK